MDRGTLALALVLLAAPLAGCIGGEDAAIDPTSAPSTNATEPLANPVQAHRVTAPNASTPVDPARVLPEGVPAPAGLGRVVDGPLFEPTIGVTSDGAIFVSNTGKGELSEEEGVPPDTAYSSILRSTDQGKTWEDVTDAIGPVSIPPETSDPYVYVDPDTDRVYNLDMIQLQCNWVRFSDDAGETWTNNPLGCGQPPVMDHPTIFAGPPTTLTTAGYENVVYLCVNRVADSACATSLDGGLTWSPWRTISPGVDPAHAEPTQGDPGLCGGLHAHGTTGPDGTVYLPKGQCGVPTVMISGDNGLTWETVVVSDEVPTIGHEVAVATDEQGNVFAFWIGEDMQPYLSYSEDEGRTWSTPVEVSPPNVPVTDKPTIAAGANGSIAVAYVGTESAAESYADVPGNATWNGYLATILDATAPDPTVMTTTANPEEDPIARGECGGTRCRAADDAGLGDFIDVTIDDEGRPWAVFVDVCLEECLETGESNREKGLGLVGTLAQGPSLRDAATPLTTLDVGAATST